MCVLGLIPLNTFPPIDSTIDSPLSYPTSLTICLLPILAINLYFCQSFLITYLQAYLYRFKMKLQLLLLSTISNMFLLVSARSLRGLNSEDDGRDSRIIGGNEATPNSYPFAVSLQDGQGHFCGGSLIARNVVLTAAHCRGGSYSVALGRHDLRTNEGQVISMQRDVAYPNYDEESTDGDFMLVFLSSPATLNSDVSIISVNPQSALPAVGSSATVVGWGVTNPSGNGGVSDKLME